MGHTRRGHPGRGRVSPRLLRAELLPGKTAGLEASVPYLEPQSQDEELAEADEAEVEAEWLPISITKSHVG